MSSLPFEEQLSESIKDAMRAKDQLRLDTLRAMKSALKYKSVDKKQEALSEGEALQVFQTLIKQRKEAIEQFEQNDRAEMAQKERQEIEIIQAFLPKALSETEVAQIVDQAIAQAGAKSAKDMGAVMKLVTPQTTGRADGKVVSDLVKQKLSAMAS